MRFHCPTREAAKGKWRGVLLELGVPESFLCNKHGPCPFCGGVDRYRFDNKEGSGSYYCNGCGAGSGFDLAMKFTGRQFADVAAEIDQILGNVKLGHDAPKREMTAAERRAALRALWANTVPIEKGDLADLYLASRGLDEVVYPPALRFGRAVNDGEGGVRPCMVAVVSAPDGKPATLHRTFLRPDGRGKAEMAAPRKLMPGPVPCGSAVRLSEPSPVLGIAEGVETALAASARFEVPVWSAINTTIMEQWEPPEGTSEVVVFGDHDPKFGGQAAAYRLAHRLAVKGITTSVQIPPAPGEDWNDALRKETA